MIFASCLRTLSLILVFASTAFAVGESPQTVTLDGVLTNNDSSSSPMLDPTANIIIEVLTPDKSCLLYEESQMVDTTNTQGAFIVHVGSTLTGSDHTKRTALDPGLTMQQIYQNITALTGKTTAGAGCGYTPAAGDIRYFRVKVTPSGGAQQTFNPDIAMDSSPNATVAETLQGLGRSDVLQVTTDTNQTKLDTIFSVLNYPKLTGLLGGTSTDYVARRGGAAEEVPALAAAPGAPSAGDMWYNTMTNSLNFYNGTTTITVAGTTLTSGFSGVLPVANGGTGTSTGSITGTGVLTFTSGPNSNVVIAPQGVGFASVTGGTASTSATTGALTVTGGVGVSGSLNVGGVAVTKPAVTNAGAAINFATGNLQYTSVSCGAFTLTGLQDGGSYMLAVQGGSAGTCSITSATNVAAAALTVHAPSAMTSSTTGALINLVVIGTHLYVAFIAY